MVTLEEPSNMKGLLLSGWGLAARACDTCRAASALLYCRADAAFLCGPCDASVHVHARSRHERVWMCEVCEQAPAAVTCKADAAALCAACDRDIHSANPLARRHERVPVVPFVDSATVAAALRSSASAATDFLDDLAAVPAPTMPTDTDTDTAADAWLIPNPNFLYNNDSDFLDFCNNNDSNKKDHRNHNQNHNDLSFQATDSVVPTQSAGNLTFSNTTTTTTTNHSFENFSFDIDFSQPNKHHHNNKFISSFNFSSSQPSASSEIGVVPDGNANSTSEVSYSFSKSGGAGTGDSPATTGAPAMDREARVLRYREKRKNRKFEKTIRYASRKAYAETRPRIKGRFAKRTESNDTSSDLFDDDRLFGLAGYGVVPTF